MYEPDATHCHTPADDMTHEAQICEQLARDPAGPHPNLCRYLGYVPTPDGQRLLGLCFERHGPSLSRAVQREYNVAFNTAAVLAGVRSGLTRLHAFGYVHNDVNPADARAVLVDFDSCRRIGASLVGKKAGTMGWDHGGDAARPENDWIGLEKVRDWLEDPDHVPPLP
ncbi:hypothetical protein B0H17DRAFT_107195 [Mycena rosella]|uniref:Protein kinase domain-containing protein n=1 Tax=Mycena rosella TaxID=1033263 RepID=A0AAD7D4C2_MYCRO|nr:hypothetical protein B0H17DRAFT_107195 [Mycena rosella]